MVKNMFVVSGVLFLRRTASLTFIYPYTFSSKTFDAFLAKWPDTPLLVVWPADCAKLPSLIAMASPHNRTDVKHMVYDTQQIKSSDKLLQATLSGVFNVTVYHDFLRNKSPGRASSLLSLAASTNGQVTYLGPYDYDKAGIVPDKELSIDDIIAQRQANSWF